MLANSKRCLCLFAWCCSLSSNQEVVFACLHGVAVCPAIRKMAPWCCTTTMSQDEQLPDADMTVMVASLLQPAVVSEECVRIRFPCQQKLPGPCICAWAQSGPAHQTGKKQKGMAQHLDFARDYSAYYYSGLDQLDFRDRTGTGIIWSV